MPKDACLAGSCVLRWHLLAIDARRCVARSTMFRTRVSSIVNFLEVRGANMRVDLSRHETFVTEEFLDTTDVRSAIEQMRGKAMSQGMRPWFGCRD